MAARRALEWIRMFEGLAGFRDGVSDLFIVELILSKTYKANFFLKLPSQALFSNLVAIKPQSQTCFSDFGLKVHSQTWFQDFIIKLFSQSLCMLV